MTAVRFWRARDPLGAAIAEWLAGADDPEVADDGGVTDGEVTGAGVAAQAGSP